MKTQVPSATQKEQGNVSDCRQYTALANGASAFTDCRADMLLQRRLQSLCASSPQETSAQAMQMKMASAQAINNFPPRALAPVVQRNKKSARLLTKLATPQVFAGPQVAIQDEIVTKLEKIFSRKSAKKQDNYKVSCVGGIVIDEPFDDLLTLQAMKLKKLDDNAVNVSSFHLLGSDVKQKIVINTLATMEQAQQLEYLQKSKIIGDEWRVIIEIHYYRDRDTRQTKFHKDTKGKTLFVNLNFVNDGPIPGPEYIINPTTNEEYEACVAQNLPEVFVEDLQYAQEKLGAPDSIGATTIPAKGVVAFVDEAIHHKTPTWGHREISIPRIYNRMKQKHSDKVDVIEAAYELATDHDLFKQQLPKKMRKQSSQWHALIDTYKTDRSKKYTRNTLAEVIPKGTLDIDWLVEVGGEEDFGSVDLNHARMGGIPVKPEDTPPLTRVRSQQLLNQETPDQPPPGRRTFFRTWVRVERK